jgi:muconolactone D-isomerase
MQFMLNIDVKLPHELSDEERDGLRTRENKRAIELIRSGHLIHIWRCVGTTANFSVWEADSFEDLHKILQSLPMFPYMNIAVTPIMRHPVTEAYESA